MDLYLNSIRVGQRGSDIDHLVIGPAGVFTINTEHHPRARIWVAGNTLIVNGTHQPYVRNSRHEARRASRLLSAAVQTDVVATGIIVPVGAQSFTVGEHPEDVLVIDRKRLVRLLTSLPEILRPDTVDYLFGRARISSTWLESPARPRPSRTLRS